MLWTAHVLEDLRRKLAERSAQPDRAFHLLGETELFPRDILDSERWTSLTALSRLRASRPLRKPRS